MSDPTEHFRLAMAAAGLEPPDTIEADRTIHRFNPTGKGHSKNGWYVLHGDGVAAGAFWDWASGLESIWCSKADTELTPAERSANTARIEAAKAQRKAEQATRHQQARAMAAKLWGEATPEAEQPNEHPYLTAKGIQPHGARLIDAAAARTMAPRLSPELVGALLVVLLADAANTLHSMQFITAGGLKRPLTGGRKQGCYFQIGGIDPAGVVVVCEGFATGAGIFEATGHTVAIAFDAGNLLAVPVFQAGRPDKATDFNDLHQLAGAAAVLACFDLVPTEPAAPHATEITTTQAHPRTTRKRRAAAGPARFKVTDGGVWQITPATDDTPEKAYFVCGKLEVLALIRDVQSGQWGRLLQWHDPDGHRHEWAMPMAALQGDGAEVRRELAAGGLLLNSSKKAREALAQYIAETDTPHRARGVDRTGWHAGAAGAMVFVFPDTTIGNAGEIVRYQSDASGHRYATAGTLAGWQTQVAALCVGNTRCTLAVSAGFAALLLHFSGLESGGINLRGSSSTGKTTALIAAASVFGAADYVQRWRATGNGIEAIAAMHNDALLILDELAQVDAREAGEIAYMLANGQGKQRSNRSGGAQARKGWRLLFVSAGEISLAQHMADGGKKAKAGQEVRMIDLAADPGAGHGLFDVLHGQPDGAALSAAIKSGAKAHHGHAATAFVQRTADGIDVDALAQHLKTEIARFVRGKFPSTSNHPGGQVVRACERFALIGVAGELATANGVTGWPAGAALQAAGACFDSWLNERGSTSNSEAPAMLAQVQAFLETHGASRFEALDATHEQRVLNRAGFYRGGAGGEREYIVLPEAFNREVCSGFDAVAVKSALLTPGSGGKAAQALRLPGLGQVRAYVLRYAGEVRE
jgi:putative DNA primase/helicase